MYRRCRAYHFPSRGVLEAKNAKPAENPYKIADDGGLYLLTNPHGSKLWRLDYRFKGKRKTLALGAFPGVSLADARDAQEDAKRKLKENTDPSEARKASKLKNKPAHAAFSPWNSASRSAMTLRSSDGPPIAGPSRSGTGSPRPKSPKVLAAEQTP